MSENDPKVPLPDQDIDVLEQARLDANWVELPEPPKSQLEYYHEWLGDDQVEKRTAADFVNYLEHRPHFDKDGNVIGKNGVLVSWGGIPLKREDVLPDHTDALENAKKYWDWDYESSNKSQLQEHENMSMSKLVKALGRAEIDNDRTKVDDLTDEIIEKIDMFAKQQKTDRHPEGMTPEAQGALLDRLLKIKEDYKRSILPPAHVSEETKKRLATEQEKADKDRLAADARVQADQARQQSESIAPSETTEPVSEPGAPDTNDTDQHSATLGTEEQSKTESDGIVGWAKSKITAAVKGMKRFADKTSKQQRAASERYFQNRMVKRSARDLAFITHNYNDGKPKKVY
jgi:hypothetical protein